jgi:uncharacterized cofD-like protein
MKNIVTVGGGTGSYTVLSGLKRVPGISLTALVSMADDGGSSGVLRDELGVLPGGDVRQCLVALSEHSEIVRKVIDYRFTEGTLKGHNFGNIFLAALEKVTGDFAEGVEIASEILQVNGRVVPITKNKAELAVELSNGEIVYGENNIQNTKIQSIGVKNISYKDKVDMNPHARTAILEADYIILGPGNYYCSVLPDIVVNGFKEALQESKAKLIFPVNLTNKLEHTDFWKASDYVKDIEKYLGKPVDIILINDRKPSKEQLERYKTEEGEGFWVGDDLNDPRVSRNDLLSKVIYNKKEDDHLPATRGFIRHDSYKLARVLKKIIRQ